MNSFALKLPKLNYKRLTVAEGLLLFVLLSFSVGVLIGVITVSNTNGTLYTLAQTAFNSTVNSKSDDSFWIYFSKSLIHFLPYIAIAYFSGTSAFGCLVLPVICVVRGISNGILTAYIYCTYNIVGIGYTALVIAPYFVFSAFVLLLACRESLCFSERILKNTLPKGTSINLFNDYKIYTLRYLIILLLAIVSSLFDAILTNMFFKYFNF